PVSCRRARARWGQSCAQVRPISVPRVSRPAISFVPRGSAGRSRSIEMKDINIELTQPILQLIAGLSREARECTQLNPIQAPSGKQWPEVGNYRLPEQVRERRSRTG